MPRIEGLNTFSQQNMVYNPEGFVFQRLSNPATPTAVNNDVYGPDRWNVLCSANAVNVSQTTDAPAGSEHAMLLTKATSNGFFGICQMFENTETVPLRNKNVMVGMQVKGTSGVTQVRISVLGWTGTADTITSSIVSSWASTPTYIANVTQYATGVFNVTTGYNQIVLPATIGGTCNNLMIFIHTPNSQTVADSLQVSQVHMNVGTYLASYTRRANADELAKCQRYCVAWASEVYTVSPANVGPNGGSTTWKFITPVPLRAVPVYTAANPTTGVVRYGSSDFNLSSVSVAGVNQNGVNMTAIGSGTTNGNCGLITTLGTVLLDAEL